MKPDALLAALLVASFAALGAFALRGRERAAPADGGAASRELAQRLAAVEAAQARTAEALASLEARVARAPGASQRAPAAESDAPADLDELAARLAALEARVERESRLTQERWRDAPPADEEHLRALRDEVALPNWSALDALHASWVADAQAARRSQLLKTARELMLEFGPPSQIYRPDGVTLFEYYRDPQGPVLRFDLMDGLVTEFAVR
ncbi:MAG: hypothetical protein H6828_01985 [Planctomycetes bacterium]|nr:hypothetical protein [Planctomycetota bacterium]